jgi:hypothetical protein
MLQVLLMRRASSLIGAVLGGYGVFCLIYSFSSPELVWRALALLSAAFALSYLSSR